MSREFEIIGAGAIGALLHRKAKHAPPAGTLCPNCETPVLGAYCHHCGQSTDNQHRSLWHLIWEGVEGLTHLDGRLGQTLPPLFFNPGKLARDQLEGRRQRHVPPFRLFLISLLIFMFVLEGLFHGTTSRRTETAKHVTTSFAIDGGKSGTTPSAPSSPPVPTTPVQSPAAGPGLHVTVAKLPAKAAPAAAVDVSEDDDDKTAAGEKVDSKGARSPVAVWFRTHLKRAIASKEYYTMVLFTWAHRLAILLLPILAGLLALVYVRRRRFFIYDHLIIAMQFLSFEFLVFAIAWLIPGPARGFAVLIATLWTPVNLYMILRGAYGSKWYTAAIKTLFLWFSTMTLFSLLMVGLFTLALAEM